MNVENLYEIFPNPSVSMDIEHGVRTNPRMHDAQEMVSIKVSWSITGSGPSSQAALAHLAHQINACIERAEKPANAEAKQ